MLHDAIKYPRTPHLEGSRLQPGDEDLDQVALASLDGAFVVVEEKVDGANASIRFDDGALVLQSRGHVLSGGPREKQFALLKTWAQTFQRDLFDVLGARYVVYGEWLFAKHTVFYDRLPHYFLEFDILDREAGKFLSTAARRRVLEGLAMVSVPVVHEGAVTSRKQLDALVTMSSFKSPRWRESLAEAAREAGCDPSRVAKETDTHDLMEGLYLKVEEGDHCVGRLKWVRHSFLTAILDSGSHWADRPIVVNGLAPEVDLFAV